MWKMLRLWCKVISLFSSFNIYCWHVLTCRANADVYYKSLFTKTQNRPVTNSTVFLMTLIQSLNVTSPPKVWSKDDTLYRCLLIINTTAALTVFWVLRVTVRLLWILWKLNSQQAVLHTFQVWSYILRKMQFWRFNSKGSVILLCSFNGISLGHSSTTDRLEAQQRVVNKHIALFQDAINKRQFFYLFFCLRYV